MSPKTRKKMPRFRQRLQADGFHPGYHLLETDWIERFEFQHIETALQLFQKAHDGYIGSHAMSDMANAGLVAPGQRRLQRIDIQRDYFQELLRYGSFIFLISL